MKILLFAADLAMPVPAKESFCIEGKTGKGWVSIHDDGPMPEDTRTSAEKVIAAMKVMMVDASKGYL
ncbi:MAG TPA: hypothetical protein VFF26_08245 [Gallionella sp.]|nr:hypothetical protein [Gallionella sp.]